MKNLWLSNPTSGLGKDIILACLNRGVKVYTRFHSAEEASKVQAWLLENGLRKEISLLYSLIIPARVTMVETFGRINAQNVTFDSLVIADPPSEKIQDSLFKHDESVLEKAFWAEIRETCFQLRSLIPLLSDAEQATAWVAALPEKRLTPGMTRVLSALRAEWVRALDAELEGTGIRVRLLELPEDPQASTYQTTLQLF